MKNVAFFTILVSSVVWTSGCSSGGSNGGSVSASAATYEQTILGDNPTFYWLLNETSGSIFADQVNGNSATVSNVFNTSVQMGIAGPIVNDANTAINIFSGLIFTNSYIASPLSFSLEFWIQALPQNAGGRIVGFGNTQESVSSQHERHVYQDVNGILYFGINDGGKVTISSPSSYADGGWHYVVATYDDPSGVLNLYVDNVQVATGFAPNYISDYNGWWRLGYDSTSGWPNSPGSLPYDGGLGQVAIYNYALSPNQVQNHFGAGGN